MLSRYLLEMTNKKSVIREISYYGLERSNVVGADNVFDFSLGNPSVPAPKSVNDSIKNVLDTNDPFIVHGYGPGVGHLSTRRAVAKSLNGRFGVNYTEDNIFMCMSAAGAIAHAVRAVTNPDEGDEVLVFAPYFPEYVPYITGAGAKVTVVPADTETFQINFNEIDKYINKNTMAVLVNTPNNPTGIVYTEETIKRLSTILEAKEKEYRHPIYIISDEPYREIVFSGISFPFIPKYYKNTMICYSFSKAISLPGGRLGYIAVNSEAEGFEHMIEIFGQASRFIGHNGPATLMQLAIESVIDDTADLSVYEENANILYDALTNMGYSCVKPGGTFYMFPRSLEPDAVKFCEKAKKLDLLLVPSDSFGCSGHFRIAYCVPTEKVKRSLPLFERLAVEYDVKSCSKMNG